MEAPATLFLDTSIYRGAGYNFSAVRLAGLKEITQFQKIKLLLPDTTLREVEDHFAKGLENAERSLRKALGNAPLLRKFFEDNYIFEFKYDHDNAKKAAWLEFGCFVSMFNDVHHLGYDLLNINEVQNWRSALEAPFSDKKPNEYSDGITLSIILGYAKLNNERVAVVSEDNDWQEACLRYEQLEYYANALAYSEHRDPKVEYYLKLKQYLRGADDLKEIIADALVKSELEYKYGWNTVVRNFKISDISSIDFSAITDSSGIITAAVSMQLSFLTLVSYDYIPRGSEKPARESSSLGSSLSVDGLLVIERKNDIWQAIKFTPEQERFDLV